MEKKTLVLLQQLSFDLSREWILYLNGLDMVPLLWVSHAMQKLMYPFVIRNTFSQRQKAHERHYKVAKQSVVAQRRIKNVFDDDDDDKQTNKKPRIKTFTRLFAFSFSFSFLDRS